MGLLSTGTPLPWHEAMKHADHVRANGISQFIHIYKTVGNRQNDCLLWGDEVEYMLVEFDDAKKKVRLDLSAQSLVERIGKTEWSIWQPEYARYMLEGVPAKPYGPLPKQILSVEENMRHRRRQIEGQLKSNQQIISMVAFPMLGMPDCFVVLKDEELSNKITRSLFFPDQAINSHARFPTLSANIRERRDKKVCINVPIFKDTHTPTPFRESFENCIFPQSANVDIQAIDDHVYLDAMGFGMGNCCLQVTFQACNIDEARNVYDLLAPLTPIAMALSAGTPILRGYLVNQDCRWNIISRSVDDRTDSERGLVTDHQGSVQKIIPKSRYDSVDCYISRSSKLKPFHNDILLLYDEQILTRLTDAGIDLLLAKHIAHLFIRDPLVIYSESLHQNNATSTDHFENIQSTNWQTLRFKPPPANSTIGWRVEFRSMEVQFTDFENAAFAVFIVLLSRAILTFDLNLYMPISKIDENMVTAHAVQAVTTRKFYFRDDLFSSENDSYSLRTIAEIMNGSATFPGLISLIKRYLNTIDGMDVETRCSLDRYLNFISCRANGTQPTNATWTREFVRSHPAYKFDSHVNDEIAYDLVQAVVEMNKDEVKM